MATRRDRTTGGALRVSVRNAEFQQWQAMLTNRSTRHRRGEFLVQGVRPISMAVAQGHPLRALLCREGPRSPWAARIVDTAEVDRVYELADDLMAELGEKDEGTPELVAVAACPADDLARLEVGPGMLVVVLDRPASPGNVGTVIRSADALGGTGVVVTGHATDPYDPRAVRASTGSVFGLPVVRVGSPDDVRRWIGDVRAAGTDLRVLGTAEDAGTDIDDAPLAGPLAVVVGNEAAGMSTAWTAIVDGSLRIPMGGTASSLNAATSASIMLYEAARQRRRARP